MVGLLTDLGATDAELGRVHHFDYPGLTLSALDAAELLRVVADVKPELLVLDSIGAALQAAGLDEINNTAWRTQCSACSCSTPPRCSPTARRLAASSTTSRLRGDDISGPLCRCHVEGARNLEPVSGHAWP